MAEGEHCSADKRSGHPDGSKRTKLRPIALLDTPLKLIESVAVDQHADHIIALLQVGFWVRDGAEAVISAMRKIPEERDEQCVDEG